MRRQHLTVTVLALGMAAAWAMAQEKRDPGRDDPQRVHGSQEQGRDAQRDQAARVDRRGLAGFRMVDSPTEAASMFRSVQHSLARAITTAEQKTGGKAVTAMCAYMDDTTRDDRTGDREQGDRSREQAERSRGGEKVCCVVTCLVGDNKFVRVIVDANNGNVIRQEDTDRVAFAGYSRDMAGARGTIGQRDMDRRARTGFEFASRWQKATDLIGKPVKNAQDEDLGRIEDIAVDARSGRILYAVLSFGGFMGMGEKWHAIPWQSLDLPQHARHLVLNVDRERIKESEGFDKNNWPNLAEERWAMTTYERYGHKPYWQRGDDRDADNRQAETITYRERWTQRPVLWQKASDLVGKDVRARTGDEEIGDMQNLAIDPDAGRILYGIVSRDGRLVAVPWNALNLSNNAEHFVIAADGAVLDRAATFDDNNWPNLTDRSWSTTVYRTFSVEPYWDDNNDGRRDER